MRATLLMVVGTGLFWATTARGELPIAVDPEPTSRPPMIVVPPPITGTRTNVLPLVPRPVLPGSVQLTVSLTDGSRLIGGTRLTEFALESDALGKLKVPVGNVRELKVAKTGAASLVMQNGDKLQAAWRLDKLELQTAFGPVTIPVVHITGVQIKTFAVAETRAEP